MQQTSKYQLNLVEGSDDFSPAPLNQNMEKVEEELEGIEESLENVVAETEAATQFIAGSGNCRIAVGSYTGNGTYGSSNPVKLTVDFTPRVVFVASNAEAGYSVNVFLYPNTQGANQFAGTSVFLTWGDRFVQWYANDQASYAMNQSGRKYYYVVIGNL